MLRPYYESDRAASEYLLLHYGGGRSHLPRGGGWLCAASNTNFPARCAAECLAGRRLPASARGLDLGCAVGRATFELARRCAGVVGIDYSARFISIARRLQRDGSLRFQSVEEGQLTETRRGVVPPGIDRRRVRFQRGDAQELSADLGHFDVILMANLIDRLSHPRKCLEQMRHFVKPGGRLVITSPYTWLAEFTPRRLWLGGFLRHGRAVKTLDSLRQILSPDFRLARRRDLPFLIREHARKFQLGVAQASVWLRRPEAS